MNCYLCQGINVSNYLKKGDFQYLKCADCEFIFLYPFPTGLKEFYSLNYFNSDSKRPEGAYVEYEVDKMVMNNFYNYYLDQLKQLSENQSPKLFDIGAATGHFLILASRKGILGEGIEISESIINYAKSLNRPVFFGESGNLNNIFLEQKMNYYDIITMWDSIEHLSDLNRSFFEIKKLLKPGGLLLVATPNVGSWWSRFFGKNWHSYLPPEHTLFFNHRNIKKFLETQGFQVILTKTIHKTFTLQYAFNIFYRWVRFPFLKPFLNFLEKNHYFGRLAFKMPLGDNMLVVAKKIAND